jgi:hypothetical protein
MTTMPKRASSSHSARIDQVDHRRVDRQSTAAAGLVPEDAARYECDCGEGFTAAVTTCVTCPSCGHGQVW